MFTDEEEKSFLLKCSTEELLKIKNFVLGAFEKKEKNETFFYDKLIEQLYDQSDLDMLWKLYISLSKCASYFLKRTDIFKDILIAILSYDWMASDPQVSTAYRHLLTTMTSMNATIIIPAYEAMMKGLSRKESETRSQVAIENKETNDEKICPEPDPIRRRQIHKTVQSILAISPTAHSLFFPVLEKLFPHKRFSLVILKDYVTELLSICEYLPSLRHPILDLIVQRCLEMDVSIVIEDTGDTRVNQDEGVDSDNDDDIFQIDDIDQAPFDPEPSPQRTKTPLKSLYSKSSVSVIENSCQVIPADVAETAEKLDALLSLLVKFIDDQQDSLEPSPSPHLDKQPAAPNNDHLYALFIRIFDERILTAHKSKFVQFLLFYMGTKASKWGVYYASHLLRLYLDETAPPLRRQTAVLYLASFVSRANYLPFPVISELLSDLVTWCGSYVSVMNSAVPSKTNPTNSRHPLTPIPTSSTFEVAEYDELGRLVVPDQSFRSVISRHETFYCGVQAACYISCFYGVEMSAQQRLSQCLRSDWASICLSPLEPMRYCQFSIRVEFLKLALVTGVLSEEVWDNMPLDIIQPGVDGTCKVGRNPLDSFFPFDPCLLRGLHHYIEPFYRHWHGVPGLESEAAKGPLHPDQDRDCDSVTVMSSECEDPMLAFSGGSGLSESPPPSPSQSQAMSFVSDGMSISMTDNETKYEDNHMADSYGDNYAASKGYGSKHESLYGFEDMLAVGPDGWPVRGHQPRHYSVGSTGSF